MGKTVHTRQTQDVFVFAQMGGLARPGKKRPPSPEPRSTFGRSLLSQALHRPCLLYLLTLMVWLPVSQAQKPETNSLQDQLRTCREGLLDPQARYDERRRWTDMLLAFRTPQANAIVVELLTKLDNAEVHRAICDVIGQNARRNPERLDATFVAPLIALLDAPDAAVRSLAARALAEFPGEQVPSELARLAAQPDVSIEKRLAAIDALAPNVHLREVVNQLMGLLDAGTPEIASRVMLVLTPVTPEVFGEDVETWRAWWREKSKLSAEAWLSDQVRIYRQRSRSLRDELSRYQSQTQRLHDALTLRMQRFQREFFRTVVEDQRNAKLAEWLADDLPVVQETAVSIIKTQIADEGRRPQDQVLSALLVLLRSDVPHLRRSALDIVQNLSDPEAVRAVLALLEVETDMPTRLAIFKALGKLDNADAVPALVREIASSTSSLECVRAAAMALGSVASKAKEESEMGHALAALKGRFENASPTDQAMHAALLFAMAGLANTAFVPEFRSALESDEPTVLRPAIRGLIAVGDQSRMRRLRTLMAHVDPLVRLEAIHAVGKLGGEEADIEGLLTRLKQTIEPDDRARKAAFLGFMHLLSRRTARERIDGANRLREDPDLQIRYLAELKDALASTNGDDGAYRESLQKLTGILEDNRRFGEAAVHLRTLYDLHKSRQEEDTLDVGLHLLSVLLRSQSSSGVSSLVQELAQSPGDARIGERIVETVANFLDDGTSGAAREYVLALIRELSSVPADLLGAEWTDLLVRSSARLAKRDHTGGASPSPPGS